MRFRPLALRCALALSLSLPAAAGAPFEVVSGGEVELQGNEQVCFTFDRDDARVLAVRVSIRFTSWVPRGYVELDGIASPDFGLPNESFDFEVDPRGVHRLKLVIEESATIDRLLLTASGAELVQASCKLYEEPRRVPVESAPDPVNRLGQPEAEPEPASRREAPPVVDRPRDERGAGPREDGPRPARAEVGTQLELVLGQALSTRDSYAGQTFRTTLNRPLLSGGDVLLPEGTLVRGRVTESKDAGRFGRSTLKLAFDSATLSDGRELALNASLQEVGPGSAKKQGTIIAGSALGGAILGKVLGGDGDSALLGAVLGGAVAAGSIAAEPGEPVVLPEGTILRVALEAPLTVPLE